VCEKVKNISLLRFFQGLYNLKCKRLVLISPISGAETQEVYEEELEEILDQQFVQEIVIYQSAKDNIFLGSLYQYKLDPTSSLLEGKNIKVNPANLDIGGKEITIDEQVINELTHEAIFLYINLKAKDKKKLEDEERSFSCKTSTVVTSIDPNDKAGSSGYDSETTPEEQRKRFIAAVHFLGYMVLFENMETATASTQDMTITDQLDPNLDWSTFAFDAIQIGTHTISAPQGSQSFSADLDFRSEMSAIVQVRSSFDPQTGVAQWYFKGVDPYTGLLADFLPPNTDDIDPKGRGWVSYSAKPKVNLPTGTVIKNKATIDFEVGVPPAPMDTPEVFNIIDSVSPVSSVSSLSSSQNTKDFAVSWSGSDDSGGSGIKNYDIYVSDNGGPYSLWLTTPETSATFTGQVGHQYSFYSRARDNVGNAEDPPSVADASTSISFAITPGEGTMGTEVTIQGHDFGSSKGKVLVDTLALNILSWEDGQIRGVLSKPMLPGTYNVAIQPKAKGASQITLQNAFTVKAAEIHSIEQGSGSAYDQVTIKGKFFGTKKGKVYLEYEQDGQMVSKSCKVTRWWMDPVTNESEIIFMVPKMLPGVCDVVVDPYSTIPEIEEGDGFEVKAPEIESVDPSPGPVGQGITISGNYFGSKKGKVYLGYIDVKNGKYVKKSCSIVSWMDDGIIFTVPKLPVGSYDVMVTNSVGSDTVVGGFEIK
jgi:hypothetical protein